jgi:(R,R)-butanediol dehydrogenase/meso-butanediol dehydrogenase/diacetyl reductase
MKVAVFHGAGKSITIEAVADDPLGPHDLRIEVGRCGICGSDVSMTSGSPFDYATGMRLGHETAGTVIEVGKAVTRCKLGDHVAIIPRGFCGACPPCRAGRVLFCETGPMHMGGFGERVVVRESAAFPFPAKVSMAEGALVEPIACGRRAMRMARLEPGASVLVLGGGSMGMAAVFWARAMGAGRIVAATRTPARHETLCAIGADAAVTSEELGSAFAEPPDIVVEAIGQPGMLHVATERVRPGGAVVSLGMCTAHDPVLPAFNAFREVSLHFPLSYSPDDFIETIRAFDAARFRPEVMVSEMMPLSALPALIEEMRGHHSHHKVQIAPAA